MSEDPVAAGMKWAIEEVVRSQATLNDEERAKLIDYKVTFETVSGQRVLAQILHGGYVNRPFPVNDMHLVMKAEGARTLALEIQRNYERAVALARGMDAQPQKATPSLTEDGHG